MKKIVRSILMLWFFVAILFANDAPKREFRAVWLSTVANIDWPKSRYDSDIKKQNDLKAYLVKLKDSGCNSVLMQVRCSCDAMYKSDIEPWSYWFSGTQGTGPSVDWDPLAFAIEEAHKLGMELHAWVNPYRAVVSPSLANNGTYISNEHVTKQHPEWILKFSDVYILDPGLPLVREYIENVLMDIVTRYDIDGLHMDDYFYPYSVISYQDTATFAFDPRGISDIQDWRRDNINLLVQGIMDSINAVKPWVKWGISPFGIYRPNVPAGISGMDAYNVLYCDPLAWLEDGSVDYLTPQCYWPFGGGQDYGKLIPWWAEQTAMYGKHFYPGQAMYRAGDSNFPYGEIPRQIRLNRSTENCDGSVFFTANDFYDNHKHTIDSLRLDLYKYPALWPVMTWKDSVPPNAPQNISFDIDINGQKTITWDASSYIDPLDSSYAYVVYRAPYPLTDLSEISEIQDIQFHHDKIYVDTDPGMYYYAVTSLDRNKLESIPGSIDLYFVEPRLPEYAEANANKDQTFTWKSYSGANLYTLEVSSSNDFTSPLYQYTLSDTSKVIGLDYQSSYFWRVRSDNISYWSPTWSLTTKLAPQVEAIAPLADFEGIQIDPELRWHAFEDAAGYEIEIARDLAMTDIVIDASAISDTTFQVPDLEYTTKYYWRVRSNKYDRWSDILSFVTRDGHIEILWQQSSIAATLQSYFHGSLEASGLAVGAYQGTAMVLLLHSFGDSVQIHALDPENGAEIPFTLNLEGVSGGLHMLRDIEFSEDGVIYASNCAAIGENFKVYQWVNAGEAPSCVYEAENVAFRLGDHITVTGNYADGGVTLYAPGARSDKLIKLEMNSISHTFDAQQITLYRANHTGPSVAIVPGTAELFVNSRAYYLRHFSAEGDFIDWMLGNVSMSVNANSIVSFKYNNKTYIAGYVVDTESATIVDVSSGASLAVSVGSTYRLGRNSNSEAIGDIEVLDNEDGTFTLYVLGNQNGVGSYIFDAASAMVDIASIAKDMHFSLKPNYPNPFNPITTIPYALDKDSDIQLSIYDLSGRLVKTLFQGQQKAGTHYLQFDARGLSSGIYVCVLRSEKQIMSRKITLLK